LGGGEAVGAGLGLALAVALGGGLALGVGYGGAGEGALPPYEDLPDPVVALSDSMTSASTSPASRV
jgi:hypothetical protein